MSERAQSLTGNLSRANDLQSLVAPARASEAEIARAALHEASHAITAFVGGLHVSQVRLRVDATGLVAYGDESDFGTLLSTVVADLAYETGRSSRFMAASMFSIIRKPP